MAEQTGKVIEAGDDGWALVVTDRRGACSGCHTSSEGCHSCLSSARMESRVANPIGAHAGDIVQISLKSGDLFRGAAILYLLPIACLLAGALMGAWLAGLYHWPQATAAAAAGLAGLAIGFTLAALLDRSPYVRRHVAPTITSVVETSGAAPAGRQAPCCH